ncbi:MAG: hypothetical protein ACOYNN_10360 [Terrimicrobiaceae bacterium]
MAKKYLSRKYKTEAAKSFKDSFTTNTNRTVGYVYLSKSTSYPDEEEASDIADTVSDEKSIWDNMILGKRVSSGDIELVVPFRRWTANTRYKQYDDKQPLDFLLSESENAGDVVYPMYVINTQGDVYKCLCNNVSSYSRVEPTGTYTQNQGFIQTEYLSQPDYLWKYMYNVRFLNKFYTDEWIPVPYGIEQNQSDYNLNSSNLVDGALNKIVVSNSGIGYVDTTVNIEPFEINSSTITVSDDIDLDFSNIKVNMTISGTGIVNGTYITGLVSETKTIRLSSSTISAGGGTTANAVTVSTRVQILGDGSETVTSVLYSGTSIRKINVTTAGTGYTRADILIYGSGTGATARAILPPKYGHGSNPALELGANNTMILCKIGEVDASESGALPTDISFRQYGLLMKPIKYGESNPVSFANANNIISQLTNVTVLGGTEYQQNEFVYQGSPTNRTFEGYVVTQTPTVVKLSNVYGEIKIGSLLNGSNSSVSRPVSAINYPTLEKYTGSILYNNNILKVERSEGQSEEIKLVFQF